MSEPCTDTIFHRVASDLAGVPLYLCRESEAVPSEWLPGDAWGFTGTDLDLSLQRWLMREGRWRGRGVAIVLRDAMMRADESLGPEEFWSGLEWTTVVHEMSHALSKSIDLKAAQPAAIEAAEQTLHTWAKTGDVQLCDGQPPRWGGHDGQFLRVLLHLAYRLGEAGQPVSLGRAVSPYLTLSHIYRYKVALGDEPARMIGLSFAGIRLSSPPRAFQAVWREDVDCWFSAIKDPTTLDCLWLAKSLSCFGKVGEV